MMKMLFLTVIFLATGAFAKPPENAISFFCPKKNKKSEEKKPELLHQIHENLVIGLCGTKEPENGNFSDFDVYIFPEAKKPILKNHTKNRKVLAMEKKDGMIFIEKVKIDKDYVEIFKNELVCSPEKCKLEKETCIVIKKDKQAWILKNLKDSKVKSKMKKLGCA